MRLDFDCIRDILLCVEENTGWKQHCFFVDCSDIGAAANDFLSKGHASEQQPYQVELWKKHKYDSGKLLYHICYCVDAGLLVQMNVPGTTDIYISDLTPDGHEFLSKIRDGKNFNKIKSVASAIGFGGLKIITAIAEDVAAAAIKQQLGLL